jgi:3-oxoadipate enol-lactonase
MPTFQRNGHTTYFEDTGGGEPLVLVCGLGADLQVWRLQVAELGKAYRVITLDNRGAGRSSAPDEPYSITQMAGDLAALLDHLEVPAANVLGWSMGGVIAQSFALAHPTRVHRLLLLSTFTATDAFLHEAIANWVNIRRSNMPYEQVVRHVARMVFSVSLARNTKAYEAFIQVMLANPYRQSVHGLVRQAAALLEYEVPSNLSSLSMPVTVLVGDSDQLTPHHMSTELVATIPGAVLRVLPGAHSGFLEYPNEYNQVILGVLRGSGTGDA